MRVNALVTGSRGFVGRNLCAVLRTMDSVRLFEYDIASPLSMLESALNDSEVIFHLAGVNRPQDPEEFTAGNIGSIEEICAILRRTGRTPKIVLSSSIQAELDNPYGVSKRGAEEALRAFAEETGAECIVYRFKNLFGKWCRPNYNSVTATFCHNVANDLPIQISAPSKSLELTYIDDVVDAFISELEPGPGGFRFAPALSGTWIALGALADKIRSFRQLRLNSGIPDVISRFDRALYATYTSYLKPDEFDYGLEIKSDGRGTLAEFLKSSSMGQLFVSRTRPGVTRGNHYHHSKTEKFFVVQGEAVIRFRHIESDNVIEYRVRGEDFRVLDIPAGYTHSIENVGSEELVTLFWASEVFDPNHPDTFFEHVLNGGARADGTPALPNSTKGKTI